MKKCVFLLMFIFAFSSCKDPDPVEILNNCDIEDAISVVWWHQILGEVNVSDFIVENTNEEYTSPIHSLKISKSTNSESGAVWGQTKIGNLPLNSRLTLSVKIKCVNLTGSGVSVAIRCDNINNQQLQFVTTQFEQLIKGTTDWKEYSITLDKLDQNAAHLMVYLLYLPNTTGTVYFDDIHLTYK